MPRRVDVDVVKQVMIDKGVWPVSAWPGGASSWLSVCMECGQFVRPRYNNVKQPGRGGCDPCGRSRSIAARTTDPAAAVAEMRASGLEPMEAFVRTDAPWRSRCLNPLCPGLWMGYPAAIAPRLTDVRQSTGSGCKYCARREIRPERARQQMIERGVEPLVPYPGRAYAPWQSRCLNDGCRRDVDPSYANVVLNGQGGCLHCAGTARVPEAQARDEMRAAGAEPLEPYPGVNSRWRCRCLAPECPGPPSRIIYPRLGWVRRGAQSCKWCAGVVIDADRAAETMRTVAGLEPQEPYPGVRERWKCWCDQHKGYVWPTLGSVNSRGSGCVECAVSGFKRDQPAQVYLIEHPERKAVKVGICNIGTRRIERHEGRGWRRYKVLDFELGSHAELLEREVVAEWRSEGWLPVREAEPYDGWTETAPLTGEITLEAMWADVVDLHGRLAADGWQND